MSCDEAADLDAVDGQQQIKHWLLVCRSSERLFLRLQPSFRSPVFRGKLFSGHVYGPVTAILFLLRLTYFRFGLVSKRWKISRNTEDFSNFVYILVLYKLCVISLALISPHILRIDEEKTFWCRSSPLYQDQSNHWSCSLMHRCEPSVWLLVWRYIQLHHVFLCFMMHFMGGLVD